MDPSCTYLVKLSKQSCDCLDWPRVQLCKHVTAVAHFFGNLNEVVAAAVDTVPKSVQPVESEGPDACSDAAAASILENVITISREFLSDSVPSSLGTVHSLHMVEAHLMVVVQSSCSSESPLLDKEIVPPNQHTWTKTTQRMGAQQWKRPQPTTTLSPEPTATQCIGDLNHKQPHLKIAVMFRLVCECLALD